MGTPLWTAPAGAPVIALPSPPSTFALASHPENAERGPFGNRGLERSGEGKP